MKHEGYPVDVCEGAHRYFVACDGTVEGSTTIKIWIVLVCTACGPASTHLVEHIMEKTSHA
jgi:hypothetical protein